MTEPERVVFSTSVEGLLRTVPEPSAALLTSIKSLGINPDRLLAAYPYDAFIRLMQLIARERWPGLAEPEAMHQVGRALMVGYRETLVGRAVTTTAKLIGPGRTLERFARNLRTANNYTESTALKLGPRRYQLELKPVRFPTYYQGVVFEVITYLGYPDVQVTIAALDGEQVKLDISW